MTKERMIELLEIEHECMRRGAHNECDRDCARCELVQDDVELDEMYTGVIALLNEQEAVEPISQTDESDLWRCGNCNHQLFRCTHQRYCEMCGREVKWND